MMGENNNPIKIVEKCSNVEPMHTQLNYNQNSREDILKNFWMSLNNTYQTNNSTSKVPPPQQPSDYSQKKIPLPPSSSDATLRLLNVITNLQNNGNPHSFLPQFPNLKTTTQSVLEESFSSATITPSFAANLQAGSLYSPTRMGYPFKLSLSGQQQIPNSQALDFSLNEKIIELENEEKDLFRLEKEYTEERKEVNSYEIKMNMAKTDVERILTQIEELENQIKDKKVQIDALEKKKSNSETMWSYLKSKLEKKRKLIREKNDMVNCLRREVPNYICNLRSSAVANIRSTPPIEREKMVNRSFSLPSLGTAEDSLKRSRELSPSQSQPVSVKIIEKSSSKSSIHHTVNSSNVPQCSPNKLCFTFNIGSCKNSNCVSQHYCIICGSSHPMISCEKERNVCVKWNMEDCVGACIREHRCLRCGLKDHRLMECPIPPTQGVEFCFAWNSSNANCKVPNCRRVHSCMRCRNSNHTVLNCPDNAAAYWNECGGKRCGLKNSSLLSSTLGNSNSSSSSSLTSASSSNITIKERLGVRQDDEDRHKRARRNSDTIHINPAVVNGSHSQNHLDIKVGRRLSDSERRMVCRDWNNNKCDSARDKCKFRHVCIRCGDYTHRERRCPMPNSD
ncbi:hypothetical protein HDU92_001097 [Lobulomyces angularis]|nr:hypothetical protein HDU92_001097 [Lobulomyces angularis]